MSIATEITRLQQAKASIKEMIEYKGVSVSDNATLEQYAQLIGLIPILAPPVIDGHSEFVLNETITISAEPGASIYYTLDETTPTISSTTYSAPFTIYATTVVKAIATKGSLTTSVASKTFTKVAGHEYVDFGLPSGRKWATTNIGADAPYDYGLYFSWGNTDGYTLDSQHVFNDSTYSGTPGSAVATDLTSANDAATQAWGGSWRMPTKNEFQELYINTDTEWVSDFEGSGKNGRKFMKKSDHSVYIFLPAAGYMGASPSQQGSYTQMWSSSFNNATTAYQFTSNVSSTGSTTTLRRRTGLPIRAVQ